ncbi:DUF305 domain-containing protein, partial [Streptomyces sp. NPDC059538]|uniref:DUF305 domain-containing protein n=1 Tax=Streptomyces sp. NPDC059538 TaxID=3346860 RepID=UPI0036ADCE5E
RAEPVVPDGAHAVLDRCALMTAHHEGAVKMAGEALAGGNNGAVEEMATEVVATQSAEIHRMRSMG